MATLHPMMLLLALLGCQSGTHLQTQKLRALEPAEIGAAVVTRGPWRVVKIGPERSILEFDGEQFALAPGPHQALLPDVPTPLGALIGNFEGSPMALVYADGGGLVAVPVAGPDVLQLELTPTHAVVGDVSEGGEISVVTIDLSTGKQIAFPSVGRPALLVEGISPDGAAIATAKLGSLGRDGTAALEVHAHGKLVQRIEVGGVQPIVEVDPAKGVVPTLDFYGHDLVWTQTGAGWRVAKICEGCTLQER